MSIEEQIDRGYLVCPTSQRRLGLNARTQQLTVGPGDRAYRVLPTGIPILLADETTADSYARESDLMNADYSVARGSSSRKAMAFLRNDYRTVAARQAFDRIFDSLPPGSLAISPGGGPVRFHPSIVNVNIGPFENVDVVADAHQLPYADSCVDAVHSEAVFEHLAEPRVAARELFRVLKPGGRGYICTPFLQQYHGYPHHYQNFTLQGHRYLFESCGFKVVEAGHAVGPSVALTTLVAAAFRNLLPRPLNRVAWVCWTALALLIRPLDKLLERHPAAHALASTTYVVLEKPATTQHFG
jgi:SAM-dependent methyltransferase/uncharacterized protein YbaR (Trm112 family)